MRQAVPKNREEQDMTVEEAKEIYIKMGCSCFGIAREYSKEDYQQYCDVATKELFRNHEKFIALCSCR